LFGLIFVGGGLAGHLMDTAGTAGYGASRGLKNPEMMVRISGVLMAAAGIGVILGIYMDLAALGIAAYCLIAGFMIHHFWTDTDDMTKNMEMSMFMKNLSIAGGGLVIFALAATGTEIG
jgi:uncharacterized membrane protein YphA (DoxX/SURF4 family)